MTQTQTSCWVAGMLNPSAPIDGAASRGKVTGTEPEARFPGEQGRDLRPGADKTAPPLSLPRVDFHRAPGGSIPGPTGTAFAWAPAC